MKAKSQAIVVYKGNAGPSRNPTKKKKNAKKKTSALAGQSAQAFKAALMDPFGPTALGAKTPDMFAAPTVTKHVGFSLTVSTDANGEADLVILPNLYMAVISSRGNLGAGGFPVFPWVTMDGITQGQCYINLPSSLSNQLTSYRIVGYGVRVYAIGSLTSTAGRALMATSAVSSWVNFRNASIGGQTTTSNNSSASATNTLLGYGVPASLSKVDITSMPSMLNCVETSLTALAQRPVTVIPKITSPEAFEFRQSADSSIGFQINNQSSASYVSS